ncbi:MAG: nodulation protein NfeD [Firmicutes bacterium]|nr:nodulation protein NfeD [Bacillota bacterium]
MYKQAKKSFAPLFPFTSIIIFLLSVVLLSAFLPGTACAAFDDEVVVIEVEGMITAGQQNFIIRQVEDAEARGAQLFVIIMDTPGGLVDATIKINQALMGASLPVAVLVAPSGAIAASAGSFIVLSADIAAMAPGTTIGAAHPVEMTPEGSAPADEKTTNFLAEHLRSLAKAKGRPEDIAEKFVTENLSLSAWDAEEAGVVDLLASNLIDLLQQLDGTVVEKEGLEYQLHTSAASLHYPGMTLSEKMQNLLSDPQVAFLLLALGMLGLYFGFSNPGTFVPEVFGGILLIMGIYGIGLFDINTTGIILLLLGAGLIIAEIFTPGFGVLGIGGALSLMAGAVMLPFEPLMSADWYGSFRLTAIGITLAIVILAAAVTAAVVYSRRRWREGGSYFKPPERGIAVSDLDPEGQIKARGELWLARSEDGTKIETGTEVEIVRSETLFLWVRSLKDSNVKNKS